MLETSSDSPAHLEDLYCRDYMSRCPKPESPKPLDFH